MVKYTVLFEVRTEFLNIIYTSFGFKGLNLNSINQLTFVMVKCGVLFEVRTEFLNVIYTSFGFKGIRVFERPCHCSGGLCPASHRGGPGQSLWDLWWTEWQWDRFSPGSSISSVNIMP
jgi:hypothetical protein